MGVVLELSSAISIDGEIVKAGCIVEVDQTLAKSLLHRGKAVLATVEPGEEEEAPAPAEQPMESPAEQPVESPAVPPEEPPAEQPEEALAVPPKHKKAKQ